MRLWSIVGNFVTNLMNSLFLQLHYFISVAQPLSSAQQTLYRLI